MGVPLCSSSCYCISLLMKGKDFISTFPVFLMDPLTCWMHWICRCETYYKSTIWVHSSSFSSTLRVYDIWHFTRIFVAIKLGHISGCWQCSSTRCRCESLFICFGRAGQFIYLHSLGVLTWLLTVEKSSSAPDPGGTLTDLCWSTLVPQSVIHLNQWFEGETHFLCIDSNSTGNWILI